MAGFKVMGIVNACLYIGLAAFSVTAAHARPLNLGMSFNTGLSAGSLPTSSLTTSYTGTTDRPALLKGLMAPDPHADEAFRDRVTQTFKSPMSEQTLAQMLTQQGFHVETGEDQAYYQEALYPCHYLWRISWDEDAQHNIRHITGRTRATCA